MPFKIKDVLIIDATVIIGLLILLTFQSISSSFIQNESSDFMNEFYGVQNQYAATLGLLEDWNCIGDKTAWEREFGDLVIPNTYNYDHVSKEMEGEIEKNCSKWIVESLELERYLMELDDWGYGFNYLHQIDEDGNVYNYSNADFQPGLYTEESDYFNSLVTGPFWVNQWNVIMMFPFVFSAAWASFNVLYSRWKGQDEETNTASWISVGSMGFGFCVLFIGLIVILGGFYEVYTPFLDQQAEYTWNTSEEVLTLEPETPPDVTRSEP